MRRSELKQRYPSEYNSWRAMSRRCYCPSDPSYKYVGAKGLAVCSRWRLSFAAFLADMGPKPGPGYSIDRKDGCLGYFPENCRWATPTQQARNRYDNRTLTFRGETRCVTEWAEITGLKATTIITRIDRFGWSAEEALGDRQRPSKPKTRNTVPGPNPRNGSSGLFGVVWHRPRQKWAARFNFNGRVHYVGHYETKERAATAVEKKLAELEGVAHVAS